MPTGIETPLLGTLLAITDESNFSRAAANLNISQSAATLRIQKLEHLVKRRLFHRGKSGIVLTDDGRVLASSARKILELDDMAISHLSKGTVPTAVSIGAIEDVASFLLEPFLAFYHRTNPGIRVDVVINASRILKRQLEEDTLKIALIKREIPPDRGQTLYRVPLVWVATANVSLI